MGTPVKPPASCIASAIAWGERSAIAVMKSPRMIASQATFMRSAAVSIVISYPQEPVPAYADQAAVAHLYVCILDDTAIDGDGALLEETPCLAPTSHGT